MHKQKCDSFSQVHHSSIAPYYKFPATLFWGNLASADVKNWKLHFLYTWNDTSLHSFLQRIVNIHFMQISFLLGSEPDIPGVGTTFLCKRARHFQVFDTCKTLSWILCLGMGVWGFKLTWTKLDWYAIHQHIYHGNYFWSKPTPSHERSSQNKST